MKPCSAGGGWLATKAGWGRSGAATLSDDAPAPSRPAAPRRARPAACCAASTSAAWACNRSGAEIRLRRHMRSAAASYSRTVASAASRRRAARSTSCAPVALHQHGLHALCVGASASACASSSWAAKPLHCSVLISDVQRPQQRDAAAARESWRSSVVGRQLRQLGMAPPNGGGNMRDDAAQRLARGSRSISALAA